jgi:multidrug resistance efflux pump
VIAFLTLCYCGLIWLIFFKLRLLPWNRVSQGAAVGVGLGGLLALLIALALYQPYSTQVRVYHGMVQIVPRVTGRVLEVPVQPNVSIKQGDVLFRIDSRPFEYAVRDLEAQLVLARRRLADVRALVREQVEPESALVRAESEADALEARLDSARLDLAESTVYAPADGTVTNLALRPGQVAAKVTANPVMTFLYDLPVILASFPQPVMRHIKPGDEAEIALDRHPGAILRARVHSIIPATGEGQLQPSGTLHTFELAPRARFGVRLELDESHADLELPAGAGGNAAIYTQRGRPIRIVRRVIIRIYTWLNYLG